MSTILVSLPDTYQGAVLLPEDIVKGVLQKFLPNLIYTCDYCLKKLDSISFNETPESINLSSVISQSLTGVAVVVLVGYFKSDVPQYSFILTCPRCYNILLSFFGSSRSTVYYMDVPIQGKLQLNTLGGTHARA